MRSLSHKNPACYIFNCWGIYFYYLSTLLCYQLLFICCSLCVFYTCRINACGNDAHLNCVYIFMIIIITIYDGGCAYFYPFFFHSIHVMIFFYYPCVYDSMEYMCVYIFVYLHMVQRFAFFVVVDQCTQIIWYKRGAKYKHKKYYSNVVAYHCCGCAERCNTWSRLCTSRTSNLNMSFFFITLTQQTKRKSLAVDLCDCFRNWIVQCTIYSWSTCWILFAYSLRQNPIKCQL